MENSSDGTFGRRSFLAAALAATALAACGSDTKQNGTSPGSSSATGSGTAAGTATGAAAPTQAPSQAATTGATTQSTGVTTAGTASANPVFGDQLRVAVTDLGGSKWDPLLGQTLLRHVFAMLFDDLVGVDYDTGNLDPKHGLATSWTEGADGTSWVFVLRDGAVFHDGTPVTAADAVFTIQRMMGPDAMHNDVALMKATISSVEMTDTHTFVVHTIGRQPLMPLYLSPASGQIGYITPKAYIEKVGNAAFNNAPVGSGPYRIGPNTPGDSVSLTATASHWLFQPRWKTVTLRQVPEVSDRLAFVQSGDADIAEGITADFAKRLGSGLRVAEQTGQSYLQFNPLWVFTPPDDPLHDERVREALSKAINRKEIVDKLLGGYGSTTDVWYGLPSLLKALQIDPAQFPDEYDPAAAKALLATAGHSDLTVKLVNYQFPGLAAGPDIVLAIKGYWEAIGVKVNIMQTDWTTFLDHWRSQNPDVFGAINHFLGGPRPVLQLVSLFDGQFVNGPAANKATHYFDAPDLEAKLTQLKASTADPDKFTSIARDIVVTGTKEHLGFPIANVSNLFAVSSKVPNFQFAFGVRLTWGPDLFMAYRAA